MKLPLPTSRKYKILECFRVKQMTLDDLIAAHGLFGTERRKVREHLWELAREGYLLYDGHDGIYTMPSRVKSRFDNIGVVTSVASPRTYDWKPLDVSILHNRSMRRVSSLDKPNSAMHTVGLHENKNYIK
jgi:hypothetical protein